MEEVLLNLAQMEEVLPNARGDGRCKARPRERDRERWEVREMKAGGGGLRPTDLEEEEEREERKRGGGRRVVTVMASGGAICEPDEAMAYTKINPNFFPNSPYTVWLHHSPDSTKKNDGLFSHRSSQPLPPQWSPSTLHRIGIAAARIARPPPMGAPSPHLLGCSGCSSDGRALTFSALRSSTSSTLGPSPSRRQRTCRLRAGTS